MKKNSSVIVIAVVWIIGMVCLYYWGHKPFDITTATTASSLILDLAIVSLVIILAGGVGRWLFGKLFKQPVSEMNRGEMAVLHSAMGLGILSLLWLLLGVLGLYYKLTAWIILLCGLLLLKKDCLAWINDLSSFSAYWRNGRKLDRYLILFLFFILILQVIWAAAPATKYDALTYHLQLPRQYLDEHRFYFVADNPYWGHPQLGEMLFTWMMLLHRGETCAFMSAAWGVLVLLGVMETVNRVVSSHVPSGENIQRNEPTSAQANARRAGLVAAVALVCSFTFRDLWHWAYIDLLSALMGWAVLSSITSVFEEKAGKWIIWIGIFCGFAIGTKWTAGVAVLAVFLCLLVFRKKLYLSWKGLLITGSLTVLFVLPWLVKNFAATDNPVYPYFFSTPIISEQRLAASEVTNSSPGWVQGLFYPLTSTIFGFDSASGFGADLGPLLALLAIPGLWPLRRQPHGAVILTGLVLSWIAILAGCISVNHLQQTRLYFVLLPWAGVASGAGWNFLTGLKSKWMRIELLLSVFVILASLFVIFQEMSKVADVDPLRMVMGQESQEEYLTRTLGTYLPAVEALDELPQEAKVLMLWEARGYYAPLNSTADLWIDRWRMDYWTYGTAEKIIESWKLQGYTHILLYKSGTEMIRATDTVLEPEGWSELDRLEELLLQTQTFGDAYILYDLSTSN